MQIPLQITFRMPQSDALEARIRERVAGLERFHPRIMSCRVTVGESVKHHQQGRQFDVRVDVRVAGHAEIVVNRDHDEDVYVALRDAFDAVTRQLEDSVREQRGDVKTHEEVQHGTVTRLFAADGFGFIETGDGRELYFSRDNVVHPTFDRLSPGDDVQFIELAGGDSGSQAKRVSRGKHGPV